jgi:hypothetical protein
MRRALWTLIIVLAGALVGSPQDAPAPEPGPPAASPEALPTAPPSPDGPARLPETSPELIPAETEISVDRRTQLSVGLGFGGPLGASATISLLRGLGADIHEESDRVKAVCALPLPHCAKGFLLEAAAGSGGGKLSLGLGAAADVETEDFHGAFGLGLKVSLARTWGSPLGTEPGLTYVGPELDFVAWRVALGLGLLFRVDGSTGKSVLFSWGLGLRL